VSGGRLLLHPSHPQRDIDPSTLELAEDSSDFDPRTGGVHYHSNEEKEQWDHPDHLVHPLQGLGKLSEIAWIMRPVVYGTALHFELVMHVSVFFTFEFVSHFFTFFPVLAARRFGVQSWKAWLLSLSVDLTSRGLMGLAFANRREGPMTALEADEYGRRAYLLLYYLLRGPFYQNFTKYVVFVANTSFRVHTLLTLRILVQTKT
jgi:peroxin-16